MKFADLFPLWAEEKKLTVRESTMRLYLQHSRIHILPYFGEFEVKQIDRQMIAAFFRAKTYHLAPSTIADITKPLSQFFQWLKASRYIKKNPYKKMLLPRIQQKEVECFSLDEFFLLYDSCYPYQRDLIHLAFFTGLRAGEILALHWEDIDLEKGVIQVKRTMSHYRNKVDYEIKPVKTIAGRRGLTLDENTLTMLKLRRYRQRDNNPFVFHNQKGEPYSRQVTSLRVACKRARIPHRSFHKLRHSNVSYLLTNGIEPFTVQRWIGHSNFFTTVNTYGHMIPGAQDKVVDVLNQIGRHHSKN